MVDFALSVIVFAMALIDIAIAIAIFAAGIFIIFMVLILLALYGVFGKRAEEFAWKITEIPKKSGKDDDSE